jgi:hypothetical protein
MAMMKSLRMVAYGFAVVAITITALLMAASGDDEGIVVALLGGTLAATPYVLVTAFEDWMRESVPPSRK